MGWIGVVRSALLGLMSVWHWHFGCNEYEDVIEDVALKQWKDEKPFELIQGSN